jgi:hypothetical protein
MINNSQQIVRMRPMPRYNLNSTWSNSWEQGHTRQRTSFPDPLAWIGIFVIPEDHQRLERLFVESWEHTIEHSESGSQA